LGVCSHLRAYKLFAESIISSRFRAKHCHFLTTALQGLCAGKKYAIMEGEPKNLNLRGIFYLKTNSKSPYALG
jgi:hypothetical protein